jgi:cysteine desulfurase
MSDIYLDHASAAPVDPRVLEFAMPLLGEGIGNPSSSHSAGSEARGVVEEARSKLAALVNAEEAKCIIFTGGATEANNLAIKGAALRNISKGKKVACSAIEHISVLNPMKELTKGGFELATVPVDSHGLVSLEKLAETVDGETTVTSVMYANNEIGTVQPIPEISEIVHQKGQFLHVDATAAGGHVPIDVQKEGIDLLTLSSNDLYGLQGVGALYVKPGIRLQTVMPGGGQERGLRSGTENLFGIAAMGEAARIAGEEMEEQSRRLTGMRDTLIEEILKISETDLTGHPTQRLPHHASFRFSGIEGESIVLNLDMGYGIQVATGSACSSKTLEPSRILLSIGLKHEQVHGSMVVTLGRSNRIEQAPIIVKAVRETVEKLRKLSPLYKEK